MWVSQYNAGPRGDRAEWTDVSNLISDPLTQLSFALFENKGVFAEQTRIRNIGIRIKLAAVEHVILSCQVSIKKRETLFDQKTPAVAEFAIEIKRRDITE